MADLLGAATGRLRRASARSRTSGIVVGVALVPWYWRWTVDRVVDPTSVEVIVDGHRVRSFTNRDWRPEYLPVEPGAHVVSVVGMTTGPVRNRRSGAVRVGDTGPKVLVELDVVVDIDEVVSLLFRRSTWGAWPDPSIRRRRLATRTRRRGRNRRSHDSGLYGGRS